MVEQLRVLMLSNFHILVFPNEVFKTEFQGFLNMNANTQNFLGLGKKNINFLLFLPLPPHTLCTGEITQESNFICHF